MKILFVDEENAYEGPIAESIAVDVFEDSDYPVSAKSRGLNVPEGKEVGNFTRYILSAVDLDLEGDQVISKQITQDDIDEADVVIAMTNEQKERLSKMCPADKLFTFFEYTLGSSDDLTSPKGYDMNAYRACLCGIGEALGTLLDKWQNEKGNE